MQFFMWLYVQWYFRRSSCYCVFRRRNFMSLLFTLMFAHHTVRLSYRSLPTNFSIYFYQILGCHDEYKLLQVMPKIIGEIITLRIYGLWLFMNRIYGLCHRNFCNFGINGKVNVFLVFLLKYEWYILCDKSEVRKLLWEVISYRCETKFSGSG